MDEYELNEIDGWNLLGMTSEAIQAHDDIKSGILCINDRFNMKNIKE